MKDNKPNRPDRPETTLEGLHFLNNNLSNVLEEVVFQLEEINKSLTQLAENKNGENNEGWNKKYKFKR